MHRDVEDQIEIIAQRADRPLAGHLGQRPDKDRSLDLARHGIGFRIDSPQVGQNHPAQLILGRRAAAKNQLRRMILADLRRIDPKSDPMSREVEAAIFVGALSEMAREWTIGALGNDLDLVLDVAMQILTPKTIRR